MKKTVRNNPLNRPVITILAVACICFAVGWWHSIGTSVAKDARINALEWENTDVRGELKHYRDAFIHLSENLPDCSALEQENSRLQDALKSVSMQVVNPPIPAPAKKGCLHLF